MKKWVFFGLLVLGATLTGWYVKGYFSDENFTYTSINPNAAYFYPLDTVPKIYHYRDIANGLDEEFHRIYTVEDAVGSGEVTQGLGLPAHLMTACAEAHLGLRDGDAGVHKLQALVLVNYGAATGHDIANLALRIQRDIAERFKVDLEMEPNQY